MECCSTVDLSAEDTQKRALAVAHDAVREVASVEEGHDVERVADTMRVNAERVVLRRESL